MRKTMVSLSRNQVVTLKRKVVVTLGGISTQTPKFTPRALAFKNTQDFVDHEDRLGNLTVLEKALNSSVQNRSAIEKVDFYDRSFFQTTKKVASDITTVKKFTKDELLKRTEDLAHFCVNRWWC